MTGLSSEAFSAPPVLLSAASASSAGQDAESRSWESRPFEMPSSVASFVKLMASLRSRYDARVDMSVRLASLNDKGKRKSLGWRNASSGGGWYPSHMSTPRHDWYLKQWLRHFGKKQADVVRDLDWNKARVSLTVSGKQQYTRDDVNELATYLNLRPFELLMHPDDAMLLRRLKADMIRLAHDASQADSGEAAPEQERHVSLG